MTKENHMAYVSKEKWARLNERYGEGSGWFGRLIEAAMDVALSDTFDDLAFQFKLNQIEDDIASLEAKTLGLRLQSANTEERLAQLQIDQAELKALWERTRTVARLSSYVRSLNHIILANSYIEEIVRVEAVDLIPKIMELNPHFILSKHIERYRFLMSL